MSRQDPDYYRLLRVWRGIGFRWWTLLGFMNAVAMTRNSESAYAYASFVFWILTACVISIHGVFGVLHATMVFAWQNKRLDYMPAMWVHHVGALVGGGAGILWGAVGCASMAVVAELPQPSRIDLLEVFAWGSTGGLLIGAWVSLRSWKVVNKLLNE